MHPLSRPSPPPDRVVRRAGSACLLISSALLVIAAFLGPLFLLLALLPWPLWGLFVGARTVRLLRRQRALGDLKCPRCRFDIAQQFRHGVERCPECGERLSLERWRIPDRDR